MLKIPEVAKRLNIHYNTARRLVVNGEIQSIKIGRVWRVKEEELEKFFSVIGNKKHLMCFKLQAYLGLRISEAVKVNISDIDFIRRKIRVYSEKTKNLE